MVLKLLILTCTVVVVFSENTLVTLPYGQINGRQTNTFKNTTFYAFQEIPYAAPPVGKLRFKAPAPVTNWSGILDTTTNTKICMQAEGTNSMQTEDCLYLNVYTPVVPNSDQKLPVMVFIHGGGFISGSGLHGPDFFMDTQEIIVVTINYRLGPFGFLSTQDDVIPGNNGLKDQRAALKWIQENIGLFGGNPSQVTIVGQSAGSASVSYHVSSKQSKGLFRAGIMESGTVLTSWSYQRYARNIAYQTASAIDRSFTENNTTMELLELLQNASADDIKFAVSHNVSVPTKHINPGYIFAPVTETGEDAFVTDLSYGSLEIGDVNVVPLIVGINSEESITQASDLGSLKALMRKYDNDLSIVVNDDFHIQDEATQILVGTAIRNIYTEGLFHDDLASSVRFISDCRYTSNIIKYGQLLAQFTQVYFYQFSYDGELGNVDVHIDGAESVGHSEELQYLWKNNRNNDIDSFPEGDVLTHKRLMKLWTNFITNLNPTFDNDGVLDNITWPQVSTDNYQYLDIRDELEVKIDPKGDTFKSWDSIYQQYGVKPFDTY